MRSFAFLLATVFLAGCSEPNVSSDLSFLETRQITLPNGDKIAAEVMVKPVDLQRGMMYRESLAPGRGMLFVHEQPQAQRYWTYQVRIPLDIVFINAQHLVLGVAANVPPCTSKASDCPTYGGYDSTTYVLEVGAGVATRSGVAAGSILSF